MSVQTTCGTGDCSKRRLWWMYHTVFVLLAIHFALVYLMPGFFSNPLGDLRGVTQLGRGQTSYGGPGGPRLFEREGRTLLYGGEQEQEHFDITQTHLKTENLHYGLGREAFPALIEPEFDTATEANSWLAPQSRVLTVKVANQVKVYPVDLLIQHEVVNDVVGGKPIFAAYCILADLGAVYDRRVGDHTLTFGVSGYTYMDPNVWDGMDAFVLWDRDTQSLWWPPMGKAVSGPLMDQPLNLLDQQFWSQSTWGQIRQKYPDAQVLKPNQRFAPPDRWPQLDTEGLKPVEEEASTLIAPRWGENISLPDGSRAP